MEKDKERFLDDLKDRLQRRSMLRHRKAQLEAILTHLQADGTGCLDGVLGTSYAYSAATFMLQIVGRRLNGGSVDTLFSTSEPEVLTIILTAAIDKIDAEIAEQDVVTMTMLIDMVCPPPH